MRIIGDIHGHIREYEALLLDAKESIQVGDMGIGFRGVTLPSHPAHRFFRGNHDSPAACRAHPNYLGDWGYNAEKSLFWFSGADSIDKQFRREGISWWRDEEMSMAELQRALDLYVQVKPHVVLSHDGPQAFLEARFGIREPSRTRQALQAAYELWQPDLWIFGHHHVRWEFTTPDGTLFMCLPELGFVDIALPLGGDFVALGGEPFYTEETLQREQKAKLEFFLTAVQGIVTLPDQRARLLTRLCLQNGGELSRKKRERHFADLTDEDIRRVEEAIGQIERTTSGERITESL